MVTNQGTATFGVSSTFLGPGLHPFYALVTDAMGRRYQTQTVWYDIVPAITLTFEGSPPALVNRQYDLQSTTNLAAGFQTAITITATNLDMQWPVTTAGAATFFRVKLDP